MTTKQTVKKHLKKVINIANCGGEFYLLLLKGSKLVPKKIEIDNDDSVELTEIFKTSVNALAENKSLKVMDLSKADERKDVIYKYDLTHIPKELNQLDAIIENDEIDGFNHKTDSFKEIKAILVLLGNADSQIAIYKHYFSFTTLNKKSTFNIFRPKQKSRFKQIDSEVLKINDKIDFFKFDDSYFIVNVDSLERNYGFHEAIKNAAKKGIKAIEKSNLIENPEVFKDRLDDISFSRRLVRSTNNSPVIEKIPVEQVILFTQKHPSLIGKFKYSNDGKKLILKTKKSQMLFVKMLNDEFLKSELTELYYESMAKDVIDDN